ncbi:MAG: amino acid adenylation domain-containing protein, partial [Pseudomonadota bacterium]
PAPDDPAGVRQRLAAPGGLKLTVRDLRDQADPAAAAAAELAVEAGRPFRLDDEPPARACLWRLGGDRWRLLLVLHHAVCDAWSLPLLWRDLGALYARALGRPAPEPPPLTRHYEDFAAWQQDFLGSAAGQALRQRWRERLTPLPEPLALPLDRPRPALRGYRGGFVGHAFTPALAQAVADLAQTVGATAFMVMLALLQALLHRISGQTDLCLGTLSAGRGRAALQDLVGFFVNTLVLRQRIDPADGLAAHLAKVRANFLAALADQDCPFETVVEAAGAPRDPSRNPLFDVLAVWQDSWPAPPELAGTAVSEIAPPFPYAKFDLGFYFYRQDGGLRVQVEFDADLFDRETVTALVERLEHLAAKALADPALPLAALPAMDPAERALVVEGFNATDAPLDAWRAIPAPMLARLAAAPDAPAVAWDDGSLTYAQFAARAAAVAKDLRAAGVRPGQVVGLCARRSAAMLVGIHGILLAGAAYAPLDPDHPEARRAGMLADLGHPLVLAAPEHAGLFADANVLPLTAEAEAAPQACPADPGDLAYVIFTSGSTGRPKGVMIEHHAAVNRILWMQGAFPLGPGDVILQKTPITFDVSVWELFWWSWVGAAVALAPPGAERDPAALVEAVERHRVTVMHFVPSMLAGFLAHLEAQPGQAARLAGLRYVFASGEALDAALVERFNRLLHAPHGMELHNLYGPTEAAVDVSWQPCSPWSGGAMVPIGKPIANTRLYVLDPLLRPLPIGVAGEICIAGAQVGRGYINRPELTAERFAPDPFAPGRRMYRTGDLGRWRRDGAIEYLGRSDFQVKVRGQRIELGEIEHALEEHPAVERAVVTAAQVAGLTELHAYLLCADDLGAAEVRRHLRASLPEYMLPARYLRLQSLPQTSSGKVDRKALAGEPLDRPELAAAALVPFEDEVLAIWRALLPGLEPGVRVSFFDAGGNSLLMIRLHERLEARWPGVFNLAELFGRATV